MCEKVSVIQLRTRMTPDLKERIEEWADKKGLLLKEAYFRLLKAGLNAKGKGGKAVKR